MLYDRVDSTINSLASFYQTNETSAISLTLMASQNNIEQQRIDSGRTTKLPQGSSVRQLILDIGKMMRDHLMSLEVIKERADLIPEVEKLTDFNFLLSLGAEQASGGFKASSRNLVEQLFDSYSVDKKRVTEKSVNYITKCLDVILNIFKQRVFSKSQ